MAEATKEVRAEFEGKRVHVRCAIWPDDDLHTVLAIRPAGSCAHIDLVLQIDDLRGMRDVIDRALAARGAHPVREAA